MANKLTTMVEINGRTFWAENILVLNLKTWKSLNPLSHPGYESKAVAYYQMWRSVKKDWAGWDNGQLFGVHQDKFTKRWCCFYQA